MTAFALGTAADTLGFIVDARDSRRRVVACAGAPACASGLIPARTLAAEIAAHLPQGGMAVHVSGCVKGCAHPAPAPLTIVGTPQGCGLIHNGKARARPDTFFGEDHVVAEAARLVSGETEIA
jgi:precorrin-3B synthase